MQGALSFSGSLYDTVQGNNVTVTYDFWLAALPPQ